MSRTQAAAHFGVAISTAITGVKLFRQSGSFTTGRMGSHKPCKISGVHHDWLVARCRAADFTWRRLVAELAERGLTVDYRSVWAFVHAEKLSFKKRLHAGEQDRQEIARRRAQWRRHQRRIDPVPLVSIDRTWTKTNRALLCGWAEKRERLLA